MKSSVLAVIITVLIATSVSAVIWTVQSIEGQVSRRVGASLQAVLGTTREALRIWQEQTVTDASSIAASEDVRRLVEQQLRISYDHAHLSGSDATRQLRRMLRPHVEQHGYVDFAVISADGIQIFSGLDEFLGESSLAKLDPNTVANVFHGTTSVGAPIRWPADSDSQYDRINILVGAPVFDDSRRVLAALLFRLDPAREFAQITRLGRLGRTGETYVFDQQARLLTPSRFESDLVRLLPGKRSTIAQLRDPGVDLTEGLQPTLPREQQPLTRMAQAATHGDSGTDFNGYRDYRGVRVVGAWVWDAELGLGLATEMEIDEANAPVKTIWNLSLVMLGIIAVAVFLILRIVAHRGRLLATNFGYQQALKARQDVLAVVAHDLKNPINSIALSSSILMKILEGESPDLGFAANNLGVIHRAAFRMNRLIEDLLLSTRIDAGQLRVRPEECDLRAFLHEFEQFVLPLTAEKSNQFVCSVDPAAAKVFADPDRLSQILSNLVGNAIKFSPAHGEVFLTIKKVNDEVEFRVRDSGPGVPPDELARIFDQYWQAKPGKAGAGLGLYISKGLVQAHGGRIWVESVVGEGTTACFTIPAVKASDETQIAKRAS